MSKNNGATSALNERLSKFTATDSGNAERLEARYGDLLRYDWAMKAWRIYDSGIWRIGDKGEARECAKATARNIVDEAKTCKVESERTALAKWSATSLNVHRIDSALSAAQSLPAFSTKTEDYDANPSLLCVENGVLDLNTGTLLPHDPKHLLTKKVNASFDLTAKCPQWDKFLKRVQPDEEQRSFLQRAVGYSIAGTPNEQAFFFLYGSGANGKSVFMEALMTLFRDYAGSLSPEMVLGDSRRQKESASPELASLKGVRLAQVPDLPQDRTLDEVLIKIITGGDTLTARRMYAESFTYKPVCTLWVRGNHKPRIKGTDEGIWRRAILIPFEARISEAERDKHLSEKLCEELSGILNWALEGYRQWKEQGLNAPQSVLKASKAYRDEEDTLGAFLSECCNLTGKETDKVPKEALWQAYNQWADGDSQYSAMRKFNDAIRGRGELTEGRMTGGAMCWLGVQLRTDQTPPPEPETEEGASESEASEGSEAVFNNSARKSLVENFTESPSLASLPSLVPFYLSKNLTEEALLIAQERTKGHDHIRTDSQNIGSKEKNQLGDYWGAFAELAAGEWLPHLGTPFETAPLIADALSIIPDVRFPSLGLTADVKSVGVGKKYATINARKHCNKMSRPDFYIIVDFQSEGQCRFGLARSEEVDAWEKRQGRNDYFSRSTEAIYFPETRSEVFEWLESVVSDKRLAHSAERN